MNEFKGTPGPWVGQYDEVVAENDAGITVCEMRTGYSEEEIDANRDLIAAAPDLLEAVKACLPFADQDGRVNGVNIVSALRKALGEKP